MLSKKIIYFSRECTVVCDGCCVKAWGINMRPRVYVQDPDGVVYPNKNGLSPKNPGKDFNYDDSYYLADHELGDAPNDPGTYEGGYSKPTKDSERLNKWCVRECERSDIFEKDEPIKVRNFEKRMYNIPTSDPNLKLDGGINVEE